ncbi:uncharacterized protein LOC143860333 [Tasmannia lanceolata]|uniref:uncharacterized protein LOC143860333 n=1 Tax=Tasmannia lanceolata TaxID=3420 RepID=UPI004063A5E6
MVEEHWNMGTINRITFIFNFRTGTLPIRYLGLPLISSRLKRQDCLPLLDKLKKRIACWPNKFLSKAGRIELAKSVLSSFQTYWCSAFNLPVSILHSIDKISRDFIWTGSDHKSFHPISWETLCYPKKEGGMGIRKASDINRAAQWRHIWHILEKSNNPQSIWFRSKYLRGRNFWQIPMPHSLSWGARSIFKNRDEFKVRICYLVGEGRDLNFWTDPWHPDGPVDSRTSIGTMLSNIPRNVSVHDIRSDPDWKEVLNSGPYGELTQIVHFGLFTKELPSYPIWKPTTDGNFSFKSAWEVIRTAIRSYLDLNQKLTSIFSLLVPIPAGFGDSFSQERNKRVFEEKTTHKQQTLKDIFDIIKFRTLYLALQDIPSEKNIRISNILGLPCFSKEKSSRHCIWVPPPEDMAKLNSDASLANDQGSIGGLIRGSTSNILVMFSWNKAPKTISELELEAILEGVKLARSMDIRKLWIETDSMNALQIITGKCNCPWRKKVTLELLQDLLTSFEMWKVSHQWREANQQQTISLNMTAL